MTREELHKLIDSEYDKLESLPSGHTLYDLEVRIELIKQKVGQALLQSQAGVSNDRRKKKKILTRSGEIDVLHDSIYSMKGTPFGYSPLVQEDMLHLSQLSVYKDASETFTRFTNSKIDSSQYQRVVQFYGVELADVIDVVAQKDSASAVHYTMVDGSMILTDEGWKETKVGRHFHSNDILKVGNETRREIMHSIYHAQMIDSEVFKSNMGHLLENAIPKGSKHVFINDGAIWIENWIHECYPNAISILDFFHGNEHVADAVKVVVFDNKEQKKLMEQYKQMLLEGKVLEVANLLEAKAEEIGKDIDGILQYLRRNAYRMQYDQYLELGLMIGSGAIEAAHRTVIQSRMKLSGQRWAKTGVDAMLKLRTRYESGRWSEVKNKVLEINFKQLNKAA